VDLCIRILICPKEAPDALRAIFYGSGAELKNTNFVHCKNKIIMK